VLLYVAKKFIIKRRGFWL